MVCKSSLFLLLCLCLPLCCVSCDNEEWTDPTDMFNYDAATGKMIKRKHNTEENVEAVCEKGGEDTCLGNNNALIMDTQKSKQVIEELKHKEDIKLSETNTNPVFRRYLRKMLNEAERFGLPEDSSSEVQYNAEMILSKQMVVEIQKFIDDEDWNLGALEDALTRTLVQFKFHNVKEWWTGVFEDYFGIDLGTTLQFLLGITCIVSLIATELWSRIGWFTQIKRLCILCFLVSVAWNWMYLYKVAFAERQTELAKLHKFGSCGEKISWSESLIEWWKGASTFQNDPCEEYFKSLMINPALMVPPTKALALTFTDFITEPLKHVGKALGEFLHGLLAEIPVFYQLLVLILIAIILMVSCYGASTTIGQVLINRNNRNTPQERLPPSVSQRPHHGNVIEGWQQPPYYLEPEYAPVYRYPRNQRPESLQALDISDDRKNIRCSGFTDVDFPLKDKDGGQDLRKEEFTQQSRGNTTQPIKALRKRSCSPRQREYEPVLESSFGHLQKEEDPMKQEIINGAQQSHIEPIHERSFQDRIEVDPVAQTDEHQSKEKPLHERSSGQLQRRENSVEEINHTEQSWKEEHLDDKSLELKGVKPHCQTKALSPEEQQLNTCTS